MNKWQQLKLEDVADVKLSNVDKKTNFNERKISLCNYTDVYKNAFINSDKVKDFMIATCNENEFEKFILREGQVAITKDSETRNDIGVSTYIKENLDNVVLGYHLALLTPNKGKLNGRFLHYWLNSQQSKKYFENNAGGSGQRCTLTLDIIKSIPLNLPTLSIQEKIALTLSNLEEKIELNNKINIELEAMAKTLYDYWFVQFDFPDKNGKHYKSSGGKMVYNEALKREIPVGWEVEPLFNAMEVQYGFPFDTSKFTDDNTQKPVIRIRDILKNTISTFSSEEVHNKYRLNRNDLLIGMDGNFHLNFWDKAGAYLNQRSVRIRSKENSEISNFQAYFQLTPYIKAREKNVSRTTVAHLSDKDLKSLFLVSAISNNHFNPKKTFDSFLDKIISNRIQNQQLTELRDWLLPMLMNGQVTVSKENTFGKDEVLAMVAEPSAVYEKVVKVVAENEVTKKPKKEKTPVIKLNNVDVYKRTLLAAEIVYKYRNEYTLGHLKLQKMLYLCKESENMNLPMNFLKQAMGPYDNRLAKSIDKQFEEKKWFKYQNGDGLKYVPLENCGNHIDDFKKYFEDQLPTINQLIETFRKFKSQDIEAVATLYACWKEAIANNELVNDAIIINKFYNWSKEKEKFNKPDLVNHLAWMRKNGIYPKN